MRTSNPVLSPEQSSHLSAILNLYIIECYRHKIIATKIGDTKWVLELEIEITHIQTLLDSFDLKTESLQYVTPK